MGGLVSAAAPRGGPVPQHLLASAPSADGADDACCCHRSVAKARCELVSAGILPKRRLRPFQRVDLTERSCSSFGLSAVWRQAPSRPPADDRFAACTNRRPPTCADRDCVHLEKRWEYSPPFA